MDEKKLYENLEAALSGAQHIEEIAAGLAPETRNSSDSIREGLEVIYSTIDAVEAILFNLLEIHRETDKTAARLDEIEEAAKTIAIIERPELAEIPQAVTLTLTPEDGGKDFYCTIPVEVIPEGLEPGDILEINIGGEDFGGEVVAITWPRGWKK